MFKPGDKVRAKVKTAIYSAGDILTAASEDTLGTLFTEELPGFPLTATNFELVPGSHIAISHTMIVSRSEMENLYPRTDLICECGASAVKSPMHSNWCVLSKKEST